MSRDGFTRGSFGDLLAQRDERLPNDGTHPLYSLTIKDGVTPKTERYEREFLVTNKESKKYKVIRTGDLVFNPSNLRWGAIATSFIQFPVLASPIYEVFYPKDTQVLDPYFLGALASSPMLMAKYLSLVEGTLVERTALKKDDFLNIEIPVPPLPEQKKIAEILSGIDKTISNELRAIAKTETILIGIFADLDLIASSGKTAILGETARVQNGYAFQSSTFSEDPGDIPLVRISNITGGIVDTSKSKRIPRSLVPSDEYKVRKGDILIAMSGATTGKIGEYQEDIPCLLNQRVGKFEFLQGEESAFFTSQLLLSGFLESRILAKAAGGAQPNISGKGIEEIEVPLPDAADQLKYGSAIQKLLAIKSRRRFLVEKYGQLKQAMAADLLSGRTRVSV